jgi:hypothetical protein
MVASVTIGCVKDKHILMFKVLMFITKIDSLRFVFCFFVVLAIYEMLNARHISNKLRLSSVPLRCDVITFINISSYI